MLFYYITGPLRKLTPDLAVVEAGGVGYALTISENTHASLAPRLNSSLPVTLYTYLSVREDGIDLYGFSGEEELSAFRMLISVSGVGPKAGISILSTLSPQKLAIAICTEDRKAIVKANGIGAKTAARIILELKDKLAKDSGLPEELSALDDTPSPDNRKSKLGEATDALLVLGYSRSEALNVLKTLDTEAMSLEDLIRSALKKLMR